jgi:excisionase family DNA binding protein
MIPNNEKQREAAHKPLLRSIRDTSEDLGIGRTKTYDLIGRGELATVQIGSRRLITVASIEALIERATGGVA